MGCTYSKKKHPKESPHRKLPSPHSIPQPEDPMPPPAPNKPSLQQHSSPSTHPTASSSQEPAFHPVPDPQRAQPQQPAPSVSENVEEDDSSHYSLPSHVSAIAKPGASYANSSSAAQFKRKQVPEDRSNYEGLFPGRKEQHYNPSQTVTLTIRDFEGTVRVTETLNLNKSTELLYAAVRPKLQMAVFSLIYQGKVLPEDDTSIGTYGVRESGTVDCLFLSASG